MCDEPRAGVNGHRRKRRRLTAADVEGDEEKVKSSPKSITNVSKRKKNPSGDQDQPDSKPKSKSPLRPKHCIVVHEKSVEDEAARSTELGSDLLSSQPWRLRGPIWHRPASPLSRLPNGTGHAALVDDVRLADQMTTAAGADEIEQAPDADCSRDDCTEEDDVDTPQDDTRYGSDSLFEADERQADAGFEASDPPSSPPVDRDKLPSPQKSTIPPKQDVQSAINFGDDLADLPSDAFASSSSSPQKSPQHGEEAILISSQPVPSQRRVLAAPQHGLRQTTLFRHSVAQDAGVQEANKRLNFSVIQRNEPPTHHELDQEAIKTWVYPINVGTIRDYQYNIVARGLFHNLLVALPTGLGKTFIAATVMLNWFRWTKKAQIVFVAPARPLVVQQVEACFHTAGIPRAETVMLTGGVPPAQRPALWDSKRVFFMTPQTLVNDLKAGWCDPKKLVLLVVDEAHRATGAYSYVEIVKFIRRFNQSFRVLALTATPGNSVETVQEVINGLDIARVEIRTEFSLDIRQYIHSKTTLREIFTNSEEMIMVMDFFTKAVQPVLNQLSQFNAYWTRDPMAITPFGLTQARQKWMGSDAGKNASFPVKGKVNRIFTVLASLAHGVELLKYHGIGPFYHTMVSFRSAQVAAQGGKYEREILDSEPFTKMMTRLQFWMNNDTFVGHPKLEYLQGRVLEHFSNAAENSTTRIMIFAHYRDSAEEIVRVLNRNAPLIRPHVFVGQAASRGSEGMDQAKQQAIIKEFKEGKYNTLVATSIGEEGLDIGEIDLIICYDSSASPIRMLQRMGRTGRKRAGAIILLLMKGKEENNFIAAKDNYEKMQTMIADGKKFDFHDDKSPRILPKGCQPVVDQRHVDIPVENSQCELLEPTKKGKDKGSKRPPKRFNMPDGVRAGFVRASRLDGNGDDSELEDPKRGKKRAKRNKEGVNDSNAQQTRLVVIPNLEHVMLTRDQSIKFEHDYLHVTDGAGDIEVSVPSMTKHSKYQRELGPVHLIQHGRATTSLVSTLSAMRNVNVTTTARWRNIVKNLDLDELCGPVQALDRAPAQQKKVTSANPTKARRTATKATASARLGVSAACRPQAAPKPRGRPLKPKPAASAPIPAKSGVRGRPRAHPPPSSPPFRKENDDDVSAAEEWASPTPPPTDPHYALPTQGISLGSETTSGSDHADVLPERDQVDSELDGFLVEGSEDDGGVSGEEVEGLTSELGRNGEADHDSADDLPRLSHFIRNAKTTAKTGTKTHAVSTGARKRRRGAQVVHDSSDDDE